MVIQAVTSGMFSEKKLVGQWHRDASQKPSGMGTDRPGNALYVFLTSFFGKMSTTEFFEQPLRRLLYLQIITASSCSLFVKIVDYRSFETTTLPWLSTQNHGVLLSSSFLCEIVNYRIYEQPHLPRGCQYKLARRHFRAVQASFGPEARCQRSVANRRTAHTPVADVYFLDVFWTSWLANGAVDGQSK